MQYNTKQRIQEGVPGMRTPPSDFSSLRCSFRGKLVKILDWQSHLWGWRPSPPSGESWVRHCKIFHPYFNNYNVIDVLIYMPVSYKCQF